MIRKQVRGSLNALLAMTLWVVWVPPVPGLQSEDWEPIPPEELALTDDPLNPGAPAVILFRETFSNHVGSYETHHRRIKILTEEGKRYADVEIPQVRGVIHVADLAARTVSPDGTIVPFNGEIYEKIVAKTRRLKILTKTFTLPAVEVGSILEYKYTLRLAPIVFFMPPWIIQEELSLIRGRFTVSPVDIGSWSVQANYYGLPPGRGLLPQGDGTYLLELERIPPFRTEAFIPPEDTLKMYVQFYYVDGNQLKKSTENADFWGPLGKEWYKEDQRFIGERKGIKRLVTQLIAPGDRPETTLRKLYARAQKVRNLTFEPAKTTKERKREKLKDNKNVEDVLKHGYGHYSEINKLFVALARAAGFDSSLVYIVTRDESTFRPGVWLPGQLNANIVWVRLGSQDLYVDPGTPHTPFGLLSWDQTNVGGLLLKKDGGVLVEVPAPVSTEAVTERRATLHLDREGSLSGEGEIIFKGQEALTHRLSGRDKKKERRIEDLERIIKTWFAAGAQIEIRNVSDWEKAGEPLRVEFSINVPQFGVLAGSRVLIPLGIFHTQRQHTFQQSERAHPVYFPHPWEENDSITLEIPEGYVLEAVPADESSSFPHGLYEISCRLDGTTLQVERRFRMDRFFIEQQFFPSLRSLFGTLRTGDEQQVVLRVTDSVRED